MSRSRFLQDRRGGVAPIFALAIIPVLGLVGAAVDYSRANSIKAGLQSALDATSLAMARLAPTLTQAQLQQQTTAYFNAMFNHPEAKNLVITPSYTTAGGSQLSVTATSAMDTSFMKVMGYPSLSIGSTSTVKWGMNRLRVALVLDVTGSMNDDGKMPAMKTATNNLLTQLKNAATTNGDVYVSIVPFVKDVNLGASNYNANWIDWTEWEDEPPYIKTNKPSNWDQIGPGDSCPFTNSSHGFRCTAGPTSSSIVSSIPSNGTYAGYICPSTDNGSKVSNKSAVDYNGCYNSVQATKTVATGSSASCGGLPNCSCSGSGSNKKCTQSYYNHNWISNARSTWNGCVVDRGNASAPHSGNYDTNVAAPTSSNKATLYAAEQYTSCPPASMGLNYNWTAMTSLVNSLTPSGNTNQGIGLQAGWMSLVGGGPFSVPAKDPTYKYSDVIILLTDGLNTQNRWYTSQSSIDAREALTCTNAKNSGVTIYAVQVNTDGDPTQNVLKNCASTPDKFFLVTSAAQIGAIFNQIGTNLSQLRIAK